MFSICCCSSLSLLFDVIPRPSIDYRQVFRPILYFQPSPLQSDSQHFHFQLFWDLLSQFYCERYGFERVFFYQQVFFTLSSFTDILPVFIKTFLGAGSSFLKFAGLHTDPRNTDPAHLFVWFTVIRNLHIQKNSFLNSTIYYHELYNIKVVLKKAAAGKEAKRHKK